MGNAEISLVVSTLGMLLMGVLAYFGKDAHGEVKAHGKTLSEQSTRLAVLEASPIKTTVEGHATRLAAIEHGFSELKSDMREVSSDLRYVKRWVESQSDPTRRKDDRS